MQSQVLFLPFSWTDCLDEHLRFEDHMHGLETYGIELFIADSLFTRLLLAYLMSRDVHD